MARTIRGSKKIRKGSYMLKELGEDGAPIRGVFPAKRIKRYWLRGIREIEAERDYLDEEEPSRWEDEEQVLRELEMGELERAREELQERAYPAADDQEAFVAPLDSEQNDFGGSGFDALEDIQNELPNTSLNDNGQNIGFAPMRQAHTFAEDTSQRLNAALEPNQLPDIVEEELEDDGLTIRREDKITSVPSVNPNQLPTKALSKRYLRRLRQQAGIQERDASERQETRGPTLVVKSRT